MVRRPPRSTRTDTRFPYTTLFRSRMRAALAEPRNMEIFARPGVGSGTLIRDLGIPQDFSGCYVLLDAGVAIYVGISRGVIGRLRQHAFGKMHFDASLAFRIAMARHPDRTIADLTRRSDERRVGNDCVSTCSARWSPSP